MLMARLPKRFTSFAREHAAVLEAYERLGTACHQEGPLDERSRALVKLALSVGAQLEGGVHAQVRKSLELGISPGELRHVAMLAIPTLGFPSAMAALSWIDDLAPRKSRRGS
jgi:alkylhydroperoxidase/carboxymuconolactone decarboxylase family protein YurZ